MELHTQARAARKALGLTQAEVAECASVSLRTYQMFETGQTSPQGQNLQAILSCLGIDSSDAAVAEATREEWPPDIRIFLDMMGMFLSTMAEAERFAFIHDETRRIIANR